MIENHVTSALAIEKLSKALSTSFCNEELQPILRTTPNVSQTGTALSPNTKKRKRDPSGSQADHARTSKFAGAPHRPLSMSMSQPFEVYQDTHPSVDAASSRSSSMLASNSATKNPDAKSQRFSPSRDPTNSELSYRHPVLLPSLTPSLFRASCSQTRQQPIQNEATNRKNININETAIEWPTSSDQQSANSKPRPLSALFANSPPKSHSPSRVDLELDVTGTASSSEGAEGDRPGPSSVRSKYWATTTGREESKHLPAAPVLVSTSAHIPPIRRPVTPLDSSRPLDNVEVTRAPAVLVKTTRVSHTTLSPCLLYMTIMSLTETKKPGSLFRFSGL